MLKLTKLIFIGLVIGSCNNEIKIAAPWKETIIVYGLLNPSDPINYIRIERGFLDPNGNAYQFVQQNDSIYSQDLEVKLMVKKNGALIDSIFPQLVDGNLFGIEKDTGLFASSPNYLYQITKKIYDSRLISGGKEDYDYELIIKNKKTGYTATSQSATTGLLESLAPVTPSSKNININDKANSFMSVFYKEGRFVKAYDLVLTFWYKETQKSDTSKKIIKSFSWNIFKNKPTKSLEGIGQELFAVSGNVFYEILNQTIKPDPSIWREALYCDVTYYGAGAELYTFIEVNKPSIGIIQKKPEYSNINNGLGIFSSRYITRINKIPISPEMKALLKTSEYSKNLSF